MTTKRRRREHVERREVGDMAVDIANLEACIDDARLSVLATDSGPDDPTDYNNLLGRLEAVRDTLPPLYRDSVFTPFRQTLRDLGPNDFQTILLFRPDLGDLMMDIAHAILQNGEGFERRATDAFQEVVSDLYDGFLSEADRAGVEPPDEGVIPPLVKWGNPENGPYTYTIAATQIFGAEAGVVSLPPANAQRGLLAWSALGHETAGHDILHADTGLRQELASSVRQALSAAEMPNRLPEYWANRIDETASDVMGILNMGPAAGIGLIGYFRGLREAVTGQAQLSNIGPSDAAHPADILRGYLAAATVQRLAFDGAAAWADVILAETRADLVQIVLEGNPVDADIAEQSADIVAEAIMRHPLASLEDHALGQIQDWRNEDERIVHQLESILTRANDLPEALEAGIYAAHAVAAGVTAALRNGGEIAVIFDRMLTILKMMHDANASWGPLFVAHPSNILRHVAYVREVEA